MKNRYTVAALIIFCGHTPAWTADTHAIYGAWKADFTKFTQSPPNQLAIHLEANACEITSSIGTPPQKYRLGAASEGGRPTMRLVDARTLELTRQTTVNRLARSRIRYSRTANSLFRSLQAA